MWIRLFPLKIDMGTWFQKDGIGEIMKMKDRHLQWIMFVNRMNIPLKSHRDNKPKAPLAG